MRAFREKKKTKNQLKSPEVRERIDELMHIMAKGQYHRPETTRMLAAKWGVAEKTIDNYVSNAANLLRLKIGDDDQIRNEMIITLGAIRTMCFERVNEPKERNAYQWFNTAIQAMDRIANLTGINAARKVEIKSEVTLEELGALQSAVEANACGTEQNFSDTPSRTSIGFVDSLR